MGNEFYIMKTDDGADLPLPRYMSEMAAGMDIFANVHENVLIAPGEIKLIPTGIKISMPKGFEAQIRPRSGLALNHGVTMVNAPGTVDADYRGEIKVIMINHGQRDFIVERGMRIAQMVICPVSQVAFTETVKLPETDRGEGGFGHTGYGAEPHFSSEGI